MRVTIEREKSGRWISRDPLGEQSGVNLYVYVGNNPISLNDMFGLDPYAGYANGSRNANDLNSFINRATQGAGSKTFGFDSPEKLVDVLKNLPTPITRLDLHGHGVYDAFYTGDADHRIFQENLDYVAELIANDTINMPMA